MNFPTLTRSKKAGRAVTDECARIFLYSPTGFPAQHKKEIWVGLDQISMGHRGKIAAQKLRRSKQRIGIFSVLSKP